MPEETDDLLYALLHAVKLVEGGVALDHLVGEYTTQARVLGGVYQLRLADGQQHALRCRGVDAWVFLAEIQVLLEAVFLFESGFVTVLVMVEYSHRFAPPSLVRHGYPLLSQKKNTGISGEANDLMQIR